MVLTDKLRRPSALAVAALLLLTVFFPLILRSKVSAYALLSSRQIKLSNSATSATGVDYRVKFEVSTTSSLGGIVVVFCENADSPIIGDTACTVPAGFDLNGAAVSGQTDGTQIQDDEDPAPLNTVDISGLTTVATSDLDDSVATTHNTLILSSASAASATAGEYVAFTITGVDNPSALGTFYARIYTYDTNTEATGYTLADPHAGGQAIDAGGIALSTAQQITITAKVQERLTFCVYTDVDCATGGTSVLLGDTNGVLDDQDEFVDKNTKFDVSTNASGDVAIRVKGNTLINGSFDIAAVGGTPTRTVEGTEQFGFCSYQSSGAGLSIDFKYDGNGNVGGGGTGVCSTGTSQTAGTGTSGGAGDGTGGGVNYIATDPYFAFDLASINTTYGEQFATKQAGSLSQGTLAFIGNIAPTTEAGIYTTILTFIATGTY